MEGIVGVSLLHRHYSSQPDEALVERFEYDVQLSKMTSITTPQKLVEVENNILPHVWKIEKDTEGGVCLIPLEYVDPRSSIELSSHEDKVLAMMANQNFLNEFSEFLLENKLNDVLGPGIIHRESLRVCEENYLNEDTFQIDGVGKSVIFDHGFLERHLNLVTTFMAWGPWSPEVRSQIVAGLPVDEITLCCKCRTHCNDEDVH